MTCRLNAIRVGKVFYVNVQTKDSRLRLGLNHDFMVIYIIAQRILFVNEIC